MKRNDELKYLKDAMTTVTRKGLNGDIHHSTYAEVKCIEPGCKKIRRVFKQDMHQVKRCEECQRKMRNARPRRKDVVKPTTPKISKPKERKRETKRPNTDNQKRKNRMHAVEKPIVQFDGERAEGQNDPKKIIV